METLIHLPLLLPTLIFISLVTSLAFLTTLVTTSTRRLSLGMTGVLGLLGISPSSDQTELEHLLFWECHTCPVLPPLSPLSHLIDCLGKDSTFLNSRVGVQMVSRITWDPGRAEKSFSHYDCYTIMKKFLLITKPDLLIAPPDMEIIDFLDTPTSLPPWLTEEELQYFASKFQKSGFTGPLNYYCTMDLNWELLAPWQGSTVTVPTKFIVGDKDIGFSLGTKDYVEGEIFKSFVPKVEVVIMDGHHFIQQEKAEEVTDEVLSFFNGLSTNV